MWATARLIFALVSTHFEQIGQLELQRRDPSGLRLVAKLARLRQRPRIGMIIPAYAARIDGAAQHLIHRHIHDLAAYIPQRLIDSRNRRSQHRPATVEAADVHRLVKMLHLHGIAADNQIFQIHYAGHRRAGFAFERGLAPARYAFVRLDFDEHIGPIGLRDPLVERDPEDAHIGDAQFRRHIAKGSGARRFVLRGNDLRRATAIVQRR